jgi:hypothetical protein
MARVPVDPVMRVIITYISRLPTRRPAIVCDCALRWRVAKLSGYASMTAVPISFGIDVLRQKYAFTCPVADQAVSCEHFCMQAAERISRVIVEQAP